MASIFDETCLLLVALQQTSNMVVTYPAEGCLQVSCLAMESSFSIVGQEFIFTVTCLPSCSLATDTRACYNILLSDKLVPGSSGHMTIFFCLTSPTDSWIDLLAILVWPSPAWQFAIIIFFIIGGAVLSP
jgi:hypothetical protein